MLLNRDVRHIQKIDMNTIDKISILRILNKGKLAYIATTNGKFVDNAIVCYANNDLKIYFGCYSDTLKGKNIARIPYVALAISTLQIHGKARIIEYKSKEYRMKLKYYKERHPQYVNVFHKMNNELYEVEPLVVWSYNPKKGEMNRDVYILDQNYYNKLKPYEAKASYEYKIL